MAEKTGITALQRAKRERLSGVPRGPKGEAQRVVVIGASAGGVEALSAVMRGLPAGLGAPVFIVLHIAPNGYSRLPAILARAGRLPVEHAKDGQPIQPGRVFVAPPNRHMVITKSKIQLSAGPKENGFRPAVDPLFRSAARSFGGGVIGVILSGGLTDGAAGMRAIKQGGGIGIVQDPDEAPFQGMPASALEMGPVDYTLGVDQIGSTIAGVLNSPVTGNDAIATPLSFSETRIPGGKPSTYTCPECHGLLWEADPEAPEYRCRVGHSFSAASLVQAQDEGIERSIWAAVRSLEESGSLARRLADQAKEGRQHLAARTFLRRAEEKERHAGVLRELLLRSKRNSAEE